jgi:hypothetical protein
MLYSILEIHGIAVMILYKPSITITTCLQLGLVHSEKYHIKGLLLTRYTILPLTNFTVSCGVERDEKTIMN